MDFPDLQKLNTAVEFLVRQNSFGETIDRLAREISHSQEPFVWSVIDLNSINDLPASIKSCWVFVLKKDVPSGCHYHPNSIQHMVMIKGQGMSQVGGVSKRMTRFDSDKHSLTDKWFVIDRGVPHEFFPEGDDVIVVSFHTCEASELEEVSCDTGEKRRYE
jgi:mannose-6-phosphate isomerase-like protein (cupin superfamily)